MTNENTYILYIDDQHEQLAKQIQLFEDDYHFKLRVASSVEKGLTQVDILHDLLGGIILDLSFPDGQIQGEEAIPLIKEKNDKVPIFILTGTTDKKKENKVTNACLEKGAVGYFEKTNFDIEVFINRIQQRVEYDIETTLLGNPVSETAVFETEKEQYKVGFFSYKLRLVSSSSQELLISWSQDVLHFIQDYSILQLQKCLIPEDRKVACYYLFKVIDEKETYQSNFNKLSREISILFNKTANSQVEFEPVTDKKKVIKLAEPHFLHKSILSFHTSKLKLRTKISGYGSNRGSESFLIPCLSTTNNKRSNSLIHQIIHSQSRIYLNCKAIQLNKTEKNVLRTLKYNHSDDLKNTLLNIPNQCFHCYVTIYDNKEISRAIINQIEKLFFEGKATVHQGIAFKPVVRLPFSTNQSSAINFISPPICSQEKVTFKSTNKPNYKVPKNAFFNGVQIGEVDNKPICLDIEQFKKHTYIIGKTGTGKTSVLYTMIMNRIYNGEGVALIDPHGDIYQRVLDNIPQERQEDIVNFNPSSKDNEIGFNMLHHNNNHPEEQSLIINELLEILDETYDLKLVGGPMFETYFTNALKLVMKTLNKPTLVDVSKCFNDESILTDLVRQCEDTELKSFFKAALNKDGDISLKNIAPYITSKLNRFINDYYIRNVLCDDEKSLDFRAIMDRGKIFLVNLNKGTLGLHSLKFLGKVLFSRLLFACYTRSEIPISNRLSFSLFIDEFQNFSSKKINFALSEVRKYNLRLILANQTLQQLDNNIANSILSNVGTIISGSISPGDAQQIAPYFEPEYSRLDLVKMNNFEFLVNTMYNNKTVSPFTIKSTP